MKWHQHLLFSTFLASVYLLVVFMFDNPIVGPLSVVSLFCYSLPDVDCKVRTKHRHWFWHSSIMPFLVFLVGFTHMEFSGVGVFCVVIGSHLLGDWKPDNEKKRGSYLIYIRKGDRMSRKRTDAYLLANSMFCFVMAFIVLFL